MADAGVIDGGMRIGARTLLVSVLLAARAGAQSPTIEERPQPPPSSFDYLQYGVAFVGEAVLSAGDVCPENATAPCILGPGGGLAIRVGYRSRSPWYVGGAYQASRHDSSNLLRLAVLQQLRAETRYYLDEGARLTPYLSGGLGAVLYGNEWGSETGGVATHLGGGLELQLTRTTVIGLALGYRPILFRGWTDTAGQRRADRVLGFGLAQMLSFHVALEVREPLPRW